MFVNLEIFNNNNNNNNNKNNNNKNNNKVFWDFLMGKNSCPLMFSKGGKNYTKIYIINMIKEQKPLMQSL